MRSSSGLTGCSSRLSESNYYSVTDLMLELEIVFLRFSLFLKAMSSSIFSCYLRYCSLNFSNSSSSSSSGLFSISKIKCLIYDLLNNTCFYLS